MVNAKMTMSGNLKVSLQCSPEPPNQSAEQAVLSASKDCQEPVSAEAAANASTGSAEQIFASVYTTVTRHCHALENPAYPSRGRSKRRNLVPGRFHLEVGSR